MLKHSRTFRFLFSTYLAVVLQALLLWQGARSARLVGGGDREVPPNEEGIISKNHQEHEGEERKLSPAERLDDSTR